MVMTSNDISRLPAEFARAERFDGIFFMDLPSAEQRQSIWKIYHKYFDLQPEQLAENPDDTDWTGAEIKTCCRLAKLFNCTLKEAADNVVPVARTSGEKIQALRAWAHRRCLSADYRGVFDKDATRKMMSEREIANRPRRRVVRGTPAAV